MSQQGATLQNYNNELVRCIEELKASRDAAHQQILKDEETLLKLQQEKRSIEERIARLQDGLNQRVNRREEYDKTIAETEGAYIKILESSQTLLHLLKKETSTLNKAATAKAFGHH
eukprot:Clim_evm38s236 gene=Clim_evmTU38s236